LTALRARTWYDATGIAPPDTTKITSITRGDYDVAIIGAGLAGLVSALTLAQGGARVIVLETDRIGSGASGRNGGFCSAGWAAGTEQITQLVGPHVAKTLDALAQHGVAWMRTRMEQSRYAACDLVQGELILDLNGATMDAAEQDRHIAQDELRQMLSARRYKSGVYTPSAFHFHPLNFMRLLAQDALNAGATIVETAPVTRIDNTKHGFDITIAGNPTQIKARNVITATGGYMGHETPFSRKHFLPIRTYIGVTDPMPEILDEHIRCHWAIADTRRAGNYYRRLPDGRLLWGMAITAFGTLDTTRIRAMILHDIKAMYPIMVAQMQSAQIGIDFAWAGNMAYARHYMPIVGAIGQNHYSLAGFGGHGMNTAPAAARALAAHILGDHDALQAFQTIPRPRVFGRLGAFAAEATYRYMRVRDALSERLS
jgi:gamma-glutamylputrescine oxidase